MSKAFCYFTLALTFVFLLVNCAPNKSNSTKLGRAKDGRGANPDAPTSHVKIGNDQLADQAKSKLAAADPKQRQVNDQAAKELVSVHMRLTDGKVALQITPANAQPITLEAELKDKKANFESQDKKIKASLSCQDKENTCLTATVDIELTKANAKANIAAIIRNMNGKVKTAQLDTTGKSETLTKFYDLLSSQERNATAENSLKTVIIQTSEIMNSQGIATSSARFMLVSKENEVIGLQGPLRLIAQGTKGKTNITLVKNIDKSLFSESIRENLQKAILKAELQEAGADYAVIHLLLNAKSATTQDAQSNQQKKQAVPQQQDQISMRIDFVQAELSGDAQKAPAITPPPAAPAMAPTLSAATDAATEQCPVGSELISCENDSKKSFCLVNNVTDEFAQGELEKVCGK